MGWSFADASWKIPEPEAFAVFVLMFVHSDEFNELPACRMYIWRGLPVNWMTATPFCNSNEVINTL